MVIEDASVTNGRFTLRDKPFSIIYYEPNIGKQVLELHKQALKEFSESYRSKQAQKEKQTKDNF